MRLNNNTILITGGTSGIGLALATRFIELGNKVIITGRTEEKLAAVKNLLPAVHTISCELTKDADIDKLVHIIEQQYPDLNVLINNAGVQYNYEFTKEPDVPYKAVHEIETNLLVPIKLSAHLLPVLQQNQGAAIVNVSSALGLVPKGSAPVYCASKAGVHIFTKALRYQLQQVKVFELIPALVDTNMTKGRGQNKISPQQLVNEFITGFARDRYEINIGKVKMLRRLHRWLPTVTEKMMMKKD